MILLLGSSMASASCKYVQIVGTNDEAHHNICQKNHDRVVRLATMHNCTKANFYFLLDKLQYTSNNDSDVINT